MVRDARYKLLDFRSDGWLEFYDLRGRTEEGENLLPDLDPEQRARFEALREEIEQRVARMEREP